MEQPLDLLQPPAGRWSCNVYQRQFGRSGCASTPLGRGAVPDDIAKVAVFLASDDSGWLTGETILASGGKR